MTTCAPSQCLHDNGYLEATVRRFAAERGGQALHRWVTPWQPATDTKEEPDA